MSNSVALRKPVECRDVSGPVVGHDLLNGSPSAQDFFEKECAQGAPGLGSESTPLGPCGEGASSLNNVSEASRMGHEHSVNISFAEKGRWCGDGGWYPDFRCLADLALVARFDVPPNIVSERRPPKAVEKGT